MTKKLIAALLLACLLLWLCTASALTSGDFEYTLNDDGTVVMAIPGQEASVGTWTLEGDRITVTITNRSAAISGTITFTPNSSVSGMDAPSTTQVGQETTRCPAVTSA